MGHYQIKTSFKRNPFFFFSCPNAVMTGRREGHIDRASLTWHGMDEVPTKNKEPGFGLQLVDGLNSLLS